MKFDTYLQLGLLLTVKIYKNTNANNMHRVIEKLTLLVLW